MEYIDIDNRDKNPSYDDIFEAFRIIGHNLDQKYYWSNGDEVTDSNKVSYLGELMSYIKDEELLNGAIDYFKNMNFVVDIGLDSEEEINMNLLCYADSDFDKLINKFPTDYFSNIDLIKIKAIVYSLFVRYDILITDYSFINLNWERFPILITLNDRIIEHNFPNVIDSIDRNGMIKYVNDIKELPIIEQITSIHNAINVCIDINHKNNSNSQSNSIEYLKKTLKNLVSMSKSVATEPKPPTPPEDKQSDVIEDDKGIEENNYLISTIEDFLEPIFELMSESDYTILVNSLKTYFDTEAFPILTKQITITGRPNKKAIGWILNRIFESQGKGVELPLLHFSKNNISLFKDVDFDETNYLRSNLYNYFATKTKYQSKKT